MSRAPGQKVPDVLDLKKLAEMTGPFVVRLQRQRQGQPAESVKLPKDSGWTHEEVQGLDQHVNSYAGGGVYYAQVTDANGSVIEWRFLIPTRSTIPGTVLAEAEMAARNAQAQAQAATQAMGAPVNPFLPPPTSQQSGSPLPPFASPGQQPPWGGWPPSPWASPWGQQQPWSGPMGPQSFDPRMGYDPRYGQPPGWLPPQVPPTPMPASPSPEVMAKLAALEQQNQQLREDTIRRQSSEGLAQLTTEFRASQQEATARFERLTQDTNARFERLLEKIAERPRGEDEQAAALKLQIERQEQQRQADLQRMESQRREDELRRDMLRIQEEARRSSDDLKVQLATAQQNQNQAQYQAIMDRMAQVQSEAAKAQREAFERAIEREPKLMEMMSLFKSLQGDDTFASKVKEFALEQLINGPGGGPNLPQVVSELGKAAIDGAKSVLTSKAEADIAKEREKQREELRAKQRIDQIRQQQQRAQAGALPANGHYVPTQAAGPVPPVVAAGAAPAPVQPQNNVIPVEFVSSPPAPSVDETADEAMEREEKPYFGDAYSQVKQLRAAVDKGLVGPDKVVEALVEAYVYFAQFNLAFQAIVDCDPETANYERLVARALPNAPGTFKRQVIEMLPTAMTKLQEELDKEEGEEEKSEPVPAA